MITTFPAIWAARVFTPPISSLNCLASPLASYYDVFFEPFDNGNTVAPLNGRVHPNGIFQDFQWYDDFDDFQLAGNCSVTKVDYQDTSVNWISLEGDNPTGWVTPHQAKEIAFRVRLGTNSRFWFNFYSDITNISFSIAHDVGVGPNGADIIWYEYGENTNYDGIWAEEYPLGSIIDNQFHTYKFKLNNSNEIELLIDDIVYHTTNFALAQNYIPIFGDYPYIQWRFDAYNANNDPPLENFAFDYIGVSNQ